jgi:hypothetical protein
MVQRSTRIVEIVTMVTTALRVINLLAWTGLTLLIWYGVNPSTVVLMFGIALNLVLFLITDFIIRVISSEVAKGA